MPRRTTEDYIEFIEERLGFDAEFISANIQEGFWNFEYYEFLRNLSDITDDIDEPQADPEVLEAIEALRLQLGGGLSDSRKVIQEAETDMVFVPSSPYCLSKCLEYCERKLGGPRTESDFRSLIRANKHMNTQGEVSTGVVSKVLRYSFSENLLMSPVGFMTWKPNEGKWQLRQGLIGNLRLRIAYVPFKYISGIIPETMPNHGHYVVFKSYRYPHLYTIPITIITRQDMDLGTQKSYADFSPKLRRTQCVVWDLEAFRLRDGPEVGKFVEYGIGAMMMNMKEGAIPNERVSECAENYKCFMGPNCFSEFLMWCNSFELEGLQCWAHNSGHFDTMMLRQQKDRGLEFTKKIENNGKRIISQTVKYLGGPSLIFKDSCAFLSNALKDLCFSFKTTHKKSSMDHAGISEQNYESRRGEWEPYLKLDVLALAEVLYIFESAIWQHYGESMSTNLTISSVANSLMRKACYLKEIFIVKDMVAQALIQQSSLGGRIFHTMTKPNPELQAKAVMQLYTEHYPELYATNKAYIDSTIQKTVCLDANKLYLAAMAMGSFPIGYAEHHSDYTHLKQQLIDGTFEGRAICDVTMEAPPIFLPPIPVRTTTYGNYFPVGVFRQPMTDIDIQEGIRFGYVLQEIHSAIHWKRHSKIFAQLMLHIFKIGCIFKKEGNTGAMEANKRLGNSTYGVNLKRPIDTEYSYTPTAVKELKKARTLPNGQVEFEWRRTPKLVCAPQLGAFILSYSRVIMNELLEKVHGHDIPNILYYGDTDSYYMSMALLPIIGYSEELGGFKNDYGGGTYIEDFRFLGPKRYSMKLKTPIDPSKAKGVLDLVMGQETDKDENWFDDLRLDTHHSDSIISACTRVSQCIEGPMTEQEDACMESTYYKHKMCGVHFMSERQRNITDDLPLADGMTIEQLPDDPTFFAQVDQFQKGERPTIRWFQDVWRRKETGVFIYNRQLKELRQSLPRRKFLANGSSVPLFTPETAIELGRLYPSTLRSWTMLPTRDYTVGFFQYDTHRMGLRFPPNTELLKQSVLTNEPRLATKFVTKGVRPSKKMWLQECDEIKMAITRHFVEDGKVYEEYEIVDMTFAGPKHKEDRVKYSRTQMLEQYAYVLLSNKEYLANQLAKDDKASQRFIRNMLTALKTPGMMYNKGVRESTQPKRPKPSKKPNARVCAEVLSGMFDLTREYNWPRDLMDWLLNIDNPVEELQRVKGKEYKVLLLWLQHKDGKAFHN